MIRRRLEAKVYPIDTQKNIAVGLRIPFNSRGIFGQNYTTAEQVKSNIINFMLTNEGERPFNNHFGANLRALLFESINSTEEVKDIISEKISMYFPQIQNRELKLSKAESSTTLYIDFSYTYNKQKDSIFISVTP